MNQEPGHTCGYIDGVVLNIDGFAYALVEDGVIPIEGRYTKQKLEIRPYVSFGGQWYHLRDKGTLIYGANDIKYQIRRYIDTEGRMLRNGVENLEPLIAAFIESQSRLPSLNHIPIDPASGINEQDDANNLFEDDEEEIDDEPIDLPRVELQFTQDEVMQDSKVIAILIELVLVRSISKALFGEPFFKLKGKDLRKCRRTPEFWWIVVDIALALASTKLLNWAFATSRLWGEEIGPYKTIPYESPQGGLEQAWDAGKVNHNNIFIRFINWWSLSGPTMDHTRSEKDENNLFGVFLDGVKLYHYSYKEENLLPMLKCLLRLKEHSQGLDAVFAVRRLSFELMIERQWSPSAIQLVLPLLNPSGFIRTSIPERIISKFALGSPDRLMFVVKNFQFRPFFSNVMKELFSRTIPSNEYFQKKTLPLLKTFAQLATPGWCQIWTPQKVESSDSSRNESEQLLKTPVLVFEDTIHQYDPKSLKPAPPIFDFENLCSPWAENCVFHLLRQPKVITEATSVLVALKQIMGCGTSLKNSNLKGKLPVESREAHNPIKKELEEWLKKQDAYAPAYSTLYITKDTSSKKRPPNIVVPKRKKQQDKDLFKLPEPICSDTLKYALIAGDIPKAKEAFENGDRLCPIVDAKHQTFAYWELMYEIVRQGRLESLKLLHERGFPLKDVLLRRHLFPTRNIIEESYGYNETDDDWPYEDAGDIHYRLIIEACKVGNLEMVRFIREVAKSSWSSNSESEFHYPTFWYAIKMDEALSKAEKEKTNYGEISSASNSSSSSSNGPSAPSSSSNNSSSSNSTQLDLSSIGLTPAMDYFESQLLAHNMSDPMTDMPFSIYAAVNGSLDALKWMESRGWNIRGDRYRRATISHFAMAAGHLDIILWLSRNDPSPYGTVTKLDNLGLSALDWALARKIPKTTYLLDNLARSVGSRPPEGPEDFWANRVTGSARILYANYIPIEIDKIEWCGAPPKKLMPPISEEFPSRCFSSYDSHDRLLISMGLANIVPFAAMKPGDFKKIEMAKDYDYLRGPIEEFLTYRDTVLVNLREDSANRERVERWAKQEKSFAERHAKTPIPSCYVVSDFVRRISIQSNFEVDFWNAWCTASYPDRDVQKDEFQNFLLLSQLAGVDMISASVEAYKREWLEFEPCVKGAICPLLEVAGECGSPKDEEPEIELSGESPYAGRKCRQTSIFAVIARTTPWNGTFSRFVCRDEHKMRGWGTIHPFAEYTTVVTNSDKHTYEHETHLQQLRFSPVIWMFTVLLPTARKVVAIVSEVFIEVALLGSIPMMEWLIDNCDVGDKTMDCYRMMMCQVAVFGALNTLKWLHHRGFPLSFTPDDSGLRVEESCRFKTSEYMPVVPDVLLLDFQERTTMEETPIIVFQKEEFGHPEIKLSRRPNFINAMIALYPVHNYVRYPKDVYFIERVDFLVKSGISLLEVDTHPDGDGWDASHYMMARRYVSLLSHLKAAHFKDAMPSQVKDKSGRTAHDILTQAALRHTSNH